ncbi:MAG: hypothetical protein K0R65_1431 [Crocinitomicaceae bacterium]|jgi:hypothetical protein|nr:hypothetical protein [Crocinitomicaceae bacterium]
MKKMILSALFVGGFFAVNSFAQQGFDNHMEAKARKALKEAGCIENGNGNFITHYTSQVTPLLDNCYSVTLFPVPNPTIAEYVRLAPAGTVTICDGEITSVTCGQ